MIIDGPAPQCRVTLVEECEPAVCGNPCIGVFVSV
jgi:hypothetical protein